MTDTEALTRWRQWATDVTGQQIAAGEKFSDEDLRFLVTYEQEQRAIRLLNALNLFPKVTDEQRKQATDAQ